MWIAIRVLGGLAIFIFGMSLMSEGFQTLVGGRLQRILEGFTRNRWSGAGLGAIITSIIQSSSVTTVMLVGFVNAGLMTMTAAVAVTMGAAIGTTITAQIIAFDIGNWAMVLIIIGFSLYFMSTGRKYKFIGEGILGLGIIFLGLFLMKEAVEPLKEASWFLSMMKSSASNPLWGILIGVVLTAIAQSSSATIGMIIAVAASGVFGVLTPAEALAVTIPFILGANIGTTVTALLASIGTNRPAKRTAIAGLMFKILGVLLFLPFLVPFRNLILWLFGGASLARQIAMAHTFFSVITTLIFLSLLNPFVRLVKYVVRGEEPPEHRDSLAVDPRVLHSPWTALTQAAQEISYMGRLSLEMVEESVGILKRMNRSVRQNIMQKETIVDNLAEAVTVYLSKTSQQSLDNDQAERLIGLMHAVNDIERLADHAENITYLALNRHENRMDFSDTGWLELDMLYEKVREMYAGILDAFSNDDPEGARQYQTYEGEVDMLASRFRKNDIGRVNQGVCIPTAGVIFLDVLSNLERIGDLANNIGHVTTGELSRI